MTIYLYCLTDAAIDPAAELRGLGGEPVRAVAAAAGGGGRAAAWVSDLPMELGPATAELVRVHDLVVRAALARETPLPARFGQTFADDCALRRALDARSGLIARALERVRGGVEMTVRALLAGRAAEVAEGAENAERKAAEGAEGGVCVGQGEREGEGRAYMARLRDRQRALATAARQAEFLQARVARAVEGVVREEVCTPLTPGVRSLSVSHLVAREAVGQYRLAVESLAASDPTLRLLVSGPWAPYSFARIADG